MPAVACHFGIVICAICDLVQRFPAHFAEITSGIGSIARNLPGIYLTGNTAAILINYVVGACGIYVRHGNITYHANGVVPVIVDRSKTKLGDLFLT